MRCPAVRSSSASGESIGCEGGKERLTAVEIELTVDPQGAVERLRHVENRRSWTANASTSARASSASERQCRATAAKSSAPSDLRTGEERVLTFGIEVLAVRVTAAMVSTWTEVMAPDANAAAVGSCSRTSRAARTRRVAAARDMRGVRRQPRCGADRAVLRPAALGVPLPGRPHQLGVDPLPQLDQILDPPRLGGTGPAGT